MTSSGVLDCALRAESAGLSVLPPREDGTKAPMGATWTEWQQQRATAEQIRRWYAGGRTGIGFVCGVVSGNLELLDFDHKPTYETFKRSAAAAGLGDLVRRIEAGYCETTPAEGVHWFYRCETIAGNLKLARRPGLLDEHGNMTVKVLIETRGEGGYAVVAPSNGKVHTSGRPYTLLSGGVEQIVTITPEERRSLHMLARSLDEMPRGSPTPKPEEIFEGATGQPGQDFAAKVSWRDMLERKGWTWVYQHGEGEAYRRPGKDRGVSATVNYGASNLFYCFSSSTPFEQNKSYTKFGLYAGLYHGGDFKAAARHLAAEGYGSPRPQVAASPEPDEWAPPAPFYAVDLPAFPCDALPWWICDEVTALAEATQTPVDLPAMIAWAVLAVACQGKVVACVRPGWIEPVNVYTVTALPSGARKSAVVAALAEPLEAFERGEAARLRSDVARGESAYKATKARLDGLQAQAAKARPDEVDRLMREAGDLAVEVATMTIPALPRLLADDVTPEKMTGLLVANMGRMAVLSPEGDLFDLMSGRYGNQPNFSVFLKGHSVEPLRVDRITRSSEFIARPHITLGLAVQPDVLRGLVATPSLGSRGLLARFLYSWPPSNLGRRKVEPPPVPCEMVNAYHSGVAALLQLQPQMDDNGKPVPHPLSLEGDAYGIIIAFATWLEPQLGTDEDLLLTGWFGKLVGQTVRIAALHHMAVHAHSGTPWAIPISKHSVSSAVTIAHYLIAHAKVAFAEMDADPGIANAKRVLRWVSDTDVRQFSKRDAFNGLRGAFKRVDALEPVLALLIEHGYIRLQQGEERQGPGRKASPVYEVNPLWQH